MTKFVFYALLSGIVPCSQAGVILSVGPASQSVILGSQVTLDINVSGLGSGTALGTYDLNVGFDSTLLSYSGIAFGNQLDISGLGDLQSVTPNAGLVEVFELSLDSPSQLISLQAPSFILATLSFDTISTGSDSAITLSTNALGDAYGNSLLASIENGTVTINSSESPAPEPPALVVTLGGLLWLIRKRSCLCTL